MQDVLTLDRRSRRTDDVELATQYQLDQIVHDFGVRSIVLIDAAGEVIAFSGEAETAARLSGCAFELATMDRKIRRTPKRSRDYACSFRKDGDSYIVAAAGSQKELREVGVFRAIMGLRRILD